MYCIYQHFRISVLYVWMENPPLNFSKCEFPVKLSTSQDTSIWIQDLFTLRLQYNPACRNKDNDLLLSAWDMVPCNMWYYWNASLMSKSPISNSIRANSSPSISRTPFSSASATACGLNVSADDILTDAVQKRPCQANFH